MIHHQRDIVRDGGQGGVDVLREYVGLTASCRGTVPRGGVGLPACVFHFLYLIVNQHDEGADDHDDTEGDDQQDGGGDLKNLLHL